MEGTLDFMFQLCFYDHAVVSRIVKIKWNPLQFLAQAVEYRQFLQVPHYTLNHYQTTWKKGMDDRNNVLEHNHTRSHGVSNMGNSQVMVESLLLL